VELESDAGRVAIEGDTRLDSVPNHRLEAFTTRCDTTCRITLKEVNMAVNTLPANLPNAPDAKLPATYERAQKALGECLRVDEAWAWQNKAAALAAYARMARDTSMRDTACRIQARAVRRAGELLRLIEPQPGKRTDIEPSGDAPTRLQAATDAGLSRDQMHTALRVANVPDKEFDEAVESARPPSVTELAAWGTGTRQTPEFQTALADPAQIDETQSALKVFAEFCDTHDAVGLARSMPAADAEVLRGYVGAIDAWLDRFVTRLPTDRAA
jgi:hypothetical protein